MRVLLCLALSVFAAVAASAEVRDSLRYIDGFEVLVAELPDELAETGLTSRRVETDVELRLRLAEVRVHSGGASLRFCKYQRSKEW